MVLATLISGMQSLEARRFEAALPEIRDAGFYRVQLAPHVSAVAGGDFSSLRLRDRHGQEQPYLVQEFPQKTAAGLQLPVDGQRVPVAQMSQVDSSDKRSYIRISFGEPYYTDELRLRFAGPRFYSRIVRMPEALPDWHQRFNQDRELVIGKAVRGRELLLVVENEDNPPLRLQQVVASQHRQFFTAWLERGSYILEYGDSSAVAPRYDITVLRDTLSKMRLPLLEAGPPELVGAPKTTITLPVERASEGAQSEFPTRTFLMWAIIGAILIALIFATRALARRIGAGADDA